ncbi:MAG TPA: hypothetical protein VH968_08080 [Gaiellaceae bacterium]
MSGAAPPTPANESTTASCEDCFFRQMQLCALPGNTVCPTFRPAAAVVQASAEPAGRHLSIAAA